jgi:hypothetical protein
MPPTRFVNPADGALTGYPYNRIPDFDRIKGAIESMRKHGPTDLAAILEEALMIFESYREPTPPTTWGAVQMTR